MKIEISKIGIWFFIPSIGIDVEYKYLFIVWLNFGLYFAKRIEL